MKQISEANLASHDLHGIAPSIQETRGVNEVVTLLPNAGPGFERQTNSRLTALPGFRPSLQGLLYLRRSFLASETLSPSNGSSDP